MASRVSVALRRMGRSAISIKESIRTHRPARTRKPSKGQRVGYLRVSSLDQNEVRQLEGLALDKTFTDKASGKDVKRPRLEAMQGFVREGDTVFCHSMDRLARNLEDLRRIVLGLTERGVHIVFVKENLTFTGEDSPMSNLLLSVMGAFAQFERELIRERQREGIAIARREGKYRGRKASLTPARAAELRRRVADGDAKAALAREFGISRDTLYRYVPVKKRRGGKQSPIPTSEL
jgi:DNA invertase Pin-like site-specific DNA recombinase